MAWLAALMARFTFHWCQAFSLRPHNSQPLKNRLWCEVWCGGKLRDVALCYFGLCYVRCLRVVCASIFFFLQFDCAYVRASVCVCVCVCGVCWWGHREVSCVKSLHWGVRRDHNAPASTQPHLELHGRFTVTPPHPSPWAPLKATLFSAEVSPGAIPNFKANQEM